MKRNIIYISILAAGMTLWTSCDHQPDFPGLDVDGEKLTNVVKYTETYVGETFSADKPAKNVLPAWLLKKYYTCDKGSTAMVTYKYAPTIAEAVSAVSNATLYTVTAENYQKMWTERIPFMYFSPKKSAASNIPGFLKTVVTEPVDKQLKVVNYYQADTDGITNGAVTFSDNIEWGLDKWKKVVTSTGSANTNNWEIKTFDNNNYLQITGYNKEAKGAVVSYLITAAPIKIYSAQLELSFKALLSNYVANTAKVSVLLTENLADFTKEAVEAANWTDISSSFTFKTSTSSSGDLTPAGKYLLAPYNGKTVYLAFKYEADNTANFNISGLRIDDVLAGYGEVVPADSYPVSAFYRYSLADAKWLPYNDVLILQPQDYEAMGVSKLTTSNALSYVSAYLGLKFPYAQSGTVKAVAFKLAEDKFMAVELQKASAGWISTSTNIDMTDEYEFDGSAWVYKRTVPKAAMNESFEGRKIVKDDPTMLEGWLNVALGEKAWYDRNYSGNTYTECTANTAKGAVDSWFVTPKLEVKSNYILTFDMTSGYYVHDALRVYISDSFSGKKEDVKADAADWVEITENFNLPQVVGKYGTFTNVGSYQMSNYVGKQVYIAFRYLGNKTTNETSTVQLDNIYVGE